MAAFKPKRPLTKEELEAQLVGGVSDKQTIKLSESDIYSAVEALQNAGSAPPAYSPADFPSFQNLELPVKFKETSDGSATIALPHAQQTPSLPPSFAPPVPPDREQNSNPSSNSTVQGTQDKRNATKMLPPQNRTNNNNNNHNNNYSAVQKPANPDLQTVILNKPPGQANKPQQVQSTPVQQSVPSNTPKQVGGATSANENPNPQFKNNNRYPKVLPTLRNPQQNQPTVPATPSSVPISQQKTSPIQEQIPASYAVPQRQPLAPNQVQQQQQRNQTPQSGSFGQPVLTSSANTHPIPSNAGSTPQVYQQPLQTSPIQPVQGPSGSFGQAYHQSQPQGGSFGSGTPQMQVPQFVPFSPSTHPQPTHPQPTHPQSTPVTHPAVPTQPTGAQNQMMYLTYDVPADWEIGFTPNGKVYFKDHRAKTTHWPPPEGWGARKTPTGELYYVHHPTQTTHWKIPPSGWTFRFTPDGKLYYIDHVTKQTHWNVP